MTIFCRYKILLLWVPYSYLCNCNSNLLQITISSVIFSGVLVLGSIQFKCVLFWLLLSHTTFVKNNEKTGPNYAWQFHSTLRNESTQIIDLKEHDMSVKGPSDVVIFYFLVFQVKSLLGTSSLSIYISYLQYFCTFINKSKQFELM